MWFMKSIPLRNKHSLIYSSCSFVTKLSPVFTFYSNLSSWEVSLLGIMQKPEELLPGKHTAELLPWFYSYPPKAVCGISYSFSGRSWLGLRCLKWLWWNTRENRRCTVWFGEVFTHCSVKLSPVLRYGEGYPNSAFSGSFNTWLWNSNVEDGHKSDKQQHSAITSCIWSLGFLLLHCHFRRRTTGPGSAQSNWRTEV